MVALQVMQLLQFMEQLFGSTVANDPGGADDLHIAVLDANNQHLRIFPLCF